MFEQRKVNQKLYRRRDREPLWSPIIAKEKRRGRTVSPGTNDWYAVVDDIGDGMVRLEIAPWPRVDLAGRLRFNEIYEQTYLLTKLQNVVNEFRKSNNQAAHDRPLRVGDSFRIQSTSKPKRDLADPHFKGNIFDITNAARDQAKIAMYAAVARRLKPSEARMLYKKTKATGKFKFTPKRNQERQRPRIPGAIAKPEV
jgi:hypothetical protein